MVRIKYSQLFIVVTVIASIWYAHQPASAQTLDLSGLTQTPLESITNTVNSVATPSTPNPGIQSSVSGINTILDRVQQTAGQTLSSTTQVVNQTVQTTTPTVNGVSQSVSKTIGNIVQTVVGTTGSILQQQPGISMGQTRQDTTQKTSADNQLNSKTSTGTQPTTDQPNQKIQAVHMQAVSAPEPVVSTNTTNDTKVPQTIHSIVTTTGFSHTIQPSKFVPFPENKVWLYVKFSALGVLLLITGWSAYRFVRNLRYHIQDQQSIT